MRDPNALIINKGHVFALLLREASNIEEQDGDEADNNFLRSLKLNTRVIKRMLTLNKELREEINDVINTDEAVESSTGKNSNKDSLTEDEESESEKNSINDKDKNEDEEIDYVATKKSSAKRRRTK
jgi:hypothetical protein